MVAEEALGIGDAQDCPPVVTKAAEPAAEEHPLEDGSEATAMSPGLLEAINRSTRGSFGDPLSVDVSSEESVFEEVEEDMPLEGEHTKRGFSSDEDCLAEKGAADEDRRGGRRRGANGGPRLCEVWGQP